MAEEKNSKPAPVVDMKKAIEERKKIVEERIKDSGGGDSTGSKLPPKFIHDCLDSNELGDGMLYAAVHAGCFIFNATTGEWLNWAGHHWERDIIGRAVSAVEGVAMTYLGEARRLVDVINKAIKDKQTDQSTHYQGIQERIYKRIGRLRSDRGRTNTIKFARINQSNGMSIEGDDLDSNPWLLGCNNGVIDLRTGILRPGRPSDKIFKSTRIDYPGIDAPSPTWDRFLHEVFNGDGNIIAFLGRLFGFAVTGLTIENVMPILIGIGRNGKGTIVETILHVLGDYAAPIQSETLLDQGRSRSASGPSPEIMQLKGLRVAFASETDEARRFSLSRVKWLTGSDTLIGRNPHDKYNTSFLPSHTLFLSTNHAPGASAQDYAFWERVCMIKFPLSFVDREPVEEFERRADKGLKETLKSEAPAILAWLVRGCLEWQQAGLDPPPSVKAARDEYQREEDDLSDFIEATCYLDARSECGATKLYQAFRSWWEEHVSKKGCPSQKRFGRMMRRKFKYQKTQAGIYMYYGVGLIDEQSTFA